MPRLVGGGKILFDNFAALGGTIVSEEKLLKDRG
jgi:hypothetical protein